MSSGRITILRSGTLTLSLPQTQDATTSALPNSHSSDSDGVLIDRLRQALAEPIEFPLLAQCAVPGDSVVIAADPEVPTFIDLLPIIVEQLQTIQDGGVRLTLLLPDDTTGENWSELVESIPLHLREQMTIVVHEPANPKQLSYLASSANGERLYVNTALVDADLIVSVGLMCHDGTLGIRGTTSGLFPVFSDAASRARFIRGEDARSEASTDELRQLVDEVGWLLGTQFTIQVIPTVAEAAAEVLCGAVDAVLKLGRERLQHRGVVRVDEPVDAVIVSVPSSHGLAWKQLGLALDQATRVVTSDGRIIVIADLPEPVGPAATLLRRCHEPFELLKPLRNEPMPDGLEVSQLIHAIEHARVFLHSRLPNDLVEELRMMPVSDAAEFSRLVAACGADTIVIPNANYASCELIQPGIRSASARSTVS